MKQRGELWWWWVVGGEGSFSVPEFVISRRPPFDIQKAGDVSQAVEVITDRRGASLLYAIVAISATTQRGRGHAIVVGSCHRTYLSGLQTELRCGL